MIPVQGRTTTTFNDWVYYFIAGHPTRVVDGKTQWQHQGDDVVTDGSQPIQAITRGIVVLVVNKYRDVTTMEGQDHNFGNQVAYRWDNGNVETFSHNRLNSVAVKVGQEVEAGTVLAYTGQSGFHYPGTVYHTHRQLVDKDGNRIDPSSPINQPNQEDDMTTEEREQHQTMWEAFDGLKKAMEPLRQREGDGALFYDTKIRNEDANVLKDTIWIDSQVGAALIRFVGTPMITKEESQNPKYVRAHSARELSK